MSSRPNVLMIAIDDLRPELGCYGRSYMHTPNMDRLAARGVQFDRAYCQVPVCGASRASLFSGVRPTPERFVDFKTRLDHDAPDVTPLHEHLHKAGYVTASHGKVLHHSGDWAAGWDHLSSRQANAFPGYRNAENIAFWERQQANAPEGQSPKPRGPAWEIGENDDAAYSDDAMLRGAIANLNELAKGDDPFLLGVGFVRPHLPFIAPKKYWDLYDRDAIELPDMSRPDDCPADAFHDAGELRGNYTGVGDLPFDDDTARTLIHGYRATTSFLDAMIGRLLDALDASGAGDNTVVMLWVDHGWNLGEHGLWCKHCLFETSLQVPLLIAGPNQGVATGRSNAIADNLDIYPTLCDLLDLPSPEHLEGVSLMPQLRDPGATRDKAASLSRYRHGESVRTERYRYTEYRQEGKVVGRMLFDHEADPDERTNLADDVQHAQTVKELAALLP